MNPYLQDILHNITTRLAKLEEAQVKKEWVGLTEEDIAVLWKRTPHIVGLYTYTDIARDIETKLKEKNSG